METDHFQEPLPIQVPLIPNQDCQIILKFALTKQLTTYHRKYVCLSNISQERVYGWLVVGMQEKLLSPPSLVILPDWTRTCR